MGCRMYQMVGFYEFGIHYLHHTHVVVQIATVANIGMFLHMCSVAA